MAIEHLILITIHCNSFSFLSIYSVSSTVLMALTALFHAANNHAVKAYILFPSFKGPEVEGYLTFKK